MSSCGHITICRRIVILTKDSIPFADCSSRIILREVSGLWGNMLLKVTRLLNPKRFEHVHTNLCILSLSWML